MVNFTTELLSKDNFFPNREMSHPQFDLYKIESCQNFNQPFPVQQQSPQQFKDIESPFEMQTKPSPSYMDADTHFNFPNNQLQNRNKFNSHVMVENRVQSAVVPPVLRESPPKFERQFSINTVMEVIESHDINDVKSSRFSGTNPTPTYSETQSFNPTYSRTQPIDIRRPIVTSNCEQTFSNCFTRSDDQHQITVLAPPASDFRERIQGCSVSSSPGGIPFTQYQEDFIHVLSPNNPSEIQQMTCPPTSHFQTFPHEPACTVTPMQASEDQMSPYQVVSPNSCDMESPTLVGNPNDGQMFTFDNNSIQFTPSQSTPDFPYSSQQQFYPPPTPPENANTVTYHPQTQYQPPPPPYDVRLASSSTSIDNFETSDPNQFQLEEVDKSVFSEDVRSLTRTPTTDQEKADQKRIRNNKACRASRERRKRRKVEAESLVDQLQDTNRQLKEKICHLEEELKSVRANVERVMIQNKYSDCQIPSVCNYD